MIDERKANAESVVERLYLAVLHLSVGKGDVRSRLITVGDDLFPLLETDFPEELQDDFKWVQMQMTKYESKYPQFSGDVEVTMRRIKNSTGQKIAEKIFEIYARVQEIRGNPLL